MIRICNALSESGYEVELIGRLKSNSISLTNRSFIQTRLKCWFEKGKLFYLEYNIRLFFYLLFKRNYFLTAIDLDTSIAALLLKFFTSRKFYFDAHEMFTEVPEVIDRKSIQKFWLSIEKRVFKNADRIYTVGFALKQYFEEKYGRKDILVIRNIPISTEDGPENLSLLPSSIKNLIPQQPFILYQGALNKGRGLERLIELIKKESLPYKLVIVGDGDIKVNLQQLVSDYQLHEQVIFLGQVHPKCLPEISRSARIGYNVSENLGLSYYYSLNNKFFDYVEAALPSVINDFPEYVEHCSHFEVGILVANDDDAIKDAIGTLMENEEVFQKIKNQCQSARKYWTWDKEKLILTDIYSGIL